ncbi:Lsr2 protein [Murinocardiopsis flavida]|uniref:Lsr2 protein n=1 Tax=Murinocardiopsis flavida TaxID=645275 RepID=A0A2P8DFX5_9ACTN|nr:Lsr2 protein [Murinocardiopsis flavida]
MAQRTTVELIDDLNGSRAEETIDFGLDGRRYEIDLSEDNARLLRAALAPFVEAARTTATARKRSAPRPDPEEPARVRAWAARNGYEVSTRGRIPGPVVAAYRAGTPAAPAPPAPATAHHPFTPSDPFAPAAP